MGKKLRPFLIEINKGYKFLLLHYYKICSFKNFYNAYNLFMNKNEFIKCISLQINLPIRVCRNFLKAQFNIIKRELNTGGELNFKNIGRLFVNVKKERILKINNKNYLLPQKNEPKIKLYRGFKNIVK